jgi:hypothetical protein
MISRVRVSLALLAVGASLSPALQAQEKTVDFRGTIGQQKVMMSILYSGDTITSAKYQYETQKEAVPVTESKSFGTTVILADDDGNVFHLHMRKANGVATTDVGDAMVMDGTMDRDALDLPVKMERVKK